MLVNRKWLALFVVPAMVVALTGCGKQEQAPVQDVATTQDAAPAADATAPAADASAAPAAAGAEFNPPVKDQGPIFYVYKDADDPANHWIPGGWMGDVTAMEVDASCMDKPFKGATCMKWTYNLADMKEGWCGCYWYDPDKNWKGDIEGAGYNLDGAKKLVLVARGETGNEVIKIGFGGLKGKWGDTAKKEINNVRLTKEWKEYTIPLEGMDLKRLIGGFFFAIDGKANGACGKKVVFYLDDIRYEF